MSNELGAQSERTSVAWQRTLLATTVVTILFARQPAGQPAMAMTALTVLAALGALTWNRRAALATTDPPPACPPLAILVVTTATCSLAAVALVTIMS